MRAAFVPPLPPRLRAAAAPVRVLAMSARRYTALLLPLCLALASPGLLARPRLTPASSAPSALRARPPPSSRPVLAFSSVPSAAVAASISSALVEARLAACVSTLPGVTSTYRWQGKVETAAELMLVVKTHTEAMDAVSEMVQRLHPYDVPELVAVPIEAGLPAYLQWMVDETSPSTVDAKPPE